MKSIDSIATQEKINDLSSPINFLLSRRSVSARLLAPPYPDDMDLSRIIAAGLRVPDHKGLQPWRIVVMKSKALQNLSHAMKRRAAADQTNSPGWIKQAAIYANAHLVICCIYAPDIDSNLPEWEQFLSAGAVCVSLVNAAIASGYAASWLSGGPTEDPSLMPQVSIKPYEQVVGMIHIGSFDKTPPERQRPNLATKVRVIE
ncbi:MAG: nitroreductase family protein [Pseudoruegeria sp.]